MYILQLLIKEIHRRYFFRMAAWLPEGYLIFILQQPKHPFLPALLRIIFYRSYDLLRRKFFEVPQRTAQFKPFLT